MHMCDILARPRGFYTRHFAPLRAVCVCGSGSGLGWVVRVTSLLFFVTFLPERRSEKVK